MARSKRRARLRSTCKWGTAVLTVLLVVVWIGSGWGRCALYALPTLSAYVDSGKLTLTWKRPWSLKPERVTWTGVDRTAYRFNWSFHLWRHAYANGVRQTWIDIPLWFFVLLAGAPSVWLIYRDWPKRPPGLCNNCNYDLRGTEHTVCPECGCALDEVGA